MIRSLSDKLLGDKIQETNPCTSEHKCKSTFRYS